MGVPTLGFKLRTLVVRAKSLTEEEDAGSVDANEAEGVKPRGGEDGPDMLTSPEGEEGRAGRDS